MSEKLKMNKIKQQLTIEINNIANRYAYGKPETVQYEIANFTVSIFKLINTIFKEEQGDKE